MGITEGAVKAEEGGWRHERKEGVYLGPEIGR
jgi:hypothetical protein